MTRVPAGSRDAGKNGGVPPCARPARWHMLAVKEPGPAAKRPGTAPGRGWEGRPATTPDTVRDQLAAFLDRCAWRREAKAAGLPEAVALVSGLPADDPPVCGRRAKKIST